MDTTHERAAVAALLSRALAGHGRGSQVRLAEALGVQPATVTKWKDGLNLPERERWPQIEEALELTPGAIAQAAGIAEGSADLQAEVARLGEEVRGMMADVRWLMDRVRALLPEPPPSPNGAEAREARPPR